MSRRLPRIDPDTEHAVRLFLARIAGSYALAGARLYGSRARGDHDAQSDADVAVFLRGARTTPSQLLRTKLAMADIAFDVMLETNILISPMPIWDEEWANPHVYSNPHLLDDIAVEGVAL